MKQPADSKLIPIYIMGKLYEVPDGLTIMRAMEHAGYRLVHGVGCRGGFCGACATTYRVEGRPRLHLQQILSAGAEGDGVRRVPVAGRPSRGR